MGHGTDKKVSDYEKWTAKVSRTENAWQVEAEIPYELLGWKERPAAGSTIGFNVARNRKTVRESSSLSFANGSFHNVGNYAVLLLDSAENCFRQIKSGLTANAEKTGDKILINEIAAWKQASNPAIMIQESENFRKRIRLVKLGKRTFVLSQLNPSDDPAIPMLPSSIANPPEKISVRAAGNEFKALPLAITNLLDRPEEYRVVIASLDKSSAEEPGLKNHEGRYFPSDKIRLYRGVRIKDGDEEAHGLRFDPLAPMDITSTVLVMQNEATPVWAVFDTAGVAPGKYAGVIRVIPLGQTIKMDSSSKKLSGNILDLPFEFEVLPFELSRGPAISQFFFSTANNNRETFLMMQEYGMNSLLVNPWDVKVQFNPDGSVKSTDTVRAEQSIMNLKKWAREIGAEQNLKIGIAYSAYLVFRDAHARKKFRYGTPEWRKAWMGYVQILENLRRKCMIANDNYFVEIQDEPNVKHMPELIYALKTAREAVPTMNFMITFASWEIPLPELEKLIPYLSHWCFWSTKYFTDEKYSALLTNLRSSGKNISFYTCETTMRLDLYKYYLLHPWRAFAYGLNMCNMYQFFTGHYRTRDWKLSSYGNVALVASEHPVSTIRLENLRIGSTDIKYMAKLAEVLKKTKSTDKKLLAEAGNFLKETPKRMIGELAHDPKAREKVREKAIDLILLLNK